MGVPLTKPGRNLGPSSKSTKVDVRQRASDARNLRRHGMIHQQWPCHGLIHDRKRRISWFSLIVSTATTPVRMRPSQHSQDTHLLQVPIQGYARWGRTTSDVHRLIFLWDTIPTTFTSNHFIIQTQEKSVLIFYFSLVKLLIAVPRRNQMASFSTLWPTI